MSKLSAWRPTAPLEMLKARAELYAGIRAFFANRSVMEVDTPLLSHGTITDPHIEPISVEVQFAGVSKAQTCYLQTSPEFAMKRLLAAGMGSIYQLGKAFRQGELGRQHNPEFTLLEWYRVGWNHLQLMDEVATLIHHLLGASCRQTTYLDAFQAALSVDPHQATVSELRHLAQQHLDIGTLELISKKEWLELLFSHLIEPQLGRTEPEFIVEYPVCQSALAQVGASKWDPAQSVAYRFELFIQGVELANGYYELTDPAEQRLRMEKELADSQSGRPKDLRLVAALESGLPGCSGVALGVDRLLMVKQSVPDIEGVLAFGFDHA